MLNSKDREPGASSHDPGSTTVPPPTDEPKEPRLTTTVSAEDLRDFVENAVEGLHSSDANGIILWANQAELDLYGYSSADYLGRP